MRKKHMRYQIRQINLTDEQIDEVNAARGAFPEWYKKKMRTTFQPTADAIWDAIDMYETVAYIKADSLEQVFEIGNIGPESNIERIRPMHSLSVGDIVIDEDGKWFFVDSFGFGEIETYQVA